MNSAWRTHTFSVARLDSPVAGVCPASGDDRPRFYLVTTAGLLLGIDADERAPFFELQLPLTFAQPGSAQVCASADGRFVAVAPLLGLTGALVDVTRGQVVKTLEREDYHSNVSGWAIAMVHRNNCDLLLCASAWNRLDAFELPSLTRVCSSEAETSLDYFYGVLSPSPSGRSVMTGGWQWHPVGSLNLLDLDAWLRVGGTPAMSTQLMTQWWDVQVCWLDENRFAVFGDGGDGGEEFGAAVPYFNAPGGVALFELEPRQQLCFLPGVTGRTLGCDGSTLYILGDSTRAYSLAHREWAEPFAGPTDLWHPGARVALSCPGLRGESGPLRLVWRPSELDKPLAPLLKSQAGALRGRVTREGLSVLADALEEVGAAYQLVAHCRENRPHGQRCWVVEACW